jgi:hypothetical protein
MQFDTLGNRRIEDLAENRQLVPDQLSRLQHRLLKTGGRLIKPARYCWLLDESRLTRPLFGAMVR